MIGRFRHRVTLNGKPTVTQDPGGTLVEAANVIGGAWAKIEPLSGREVWEAQRLQHPVSHRIRVRYLAARMAARGIVFDGRNFEVHAAINVGERMRVIEYLVEEETT